MFLRLMLILTLLMLQGCSEPSEEQSPQALSHSVTNDVSVDEPDWDYQLPGADLSIPDWVGQRADEPYDVKAYLMSRMPPAENAADLYLKAMGKYSPDFSFIYPEEQLPMHRASLAEQESHREYVLELIRAGENQAEEAMEEMSLFLDRIEPYMSMIDTAQERPECVFITGSDMHSVLSHVQESRRVMQMNAIEIAYSCAVDDFVNAEKSLGRVLRLSRDLQPRGFLITMLVCNAIEREIFEALVINYLQHPELTVESCDRLTEILKDHQEYSLDRLKESMQMEYIMLANALAKVESGQLRASSVINGIYETESNEEAADRRFKRWLESVRFNFDVEWKALNHLYAEGFKHIEHPHKAIQIFDKETKLILASVMDESNGSKGMWNSWMTKLGVRQFKSPMLISQLLPSMEPAKQFVVSKTRSNAMCMLTAVKRYQLQNGELPETLKQAAVEAGFEGVLSDPFDGEPLRYVVRDGKAVIYSIGADMQDDGGVIDWDKGRQPGDILFPVP